MSFRKSVIKWIAQCTAHGTRQAVHFLRLKEDSEQQIHPLLRHPVAILHLQSLRLFPLVNHKSCRIRITQQLQSYASFILTMDVGKRLHSA